jgi:hypothetical protein
VPYNVIIGVATTSGVSNLGETGKSRDWVEEHVAAPRREGLDILFGGHVLSWNRIRTIQITELPAADSSPYQRGRRNQQVAPSRDVTHEFITGAPGTHRAPKDGTGGSLADFSDDELIEELRRRLGRRRSTY